MSVTLSYKPAKTRAIMPAPLQPGDKIAIPSPASAAVPAYFQPAEEMLKAQGWKVRVMPSAMGKVGSYSGTLNQRLDDMRNALTDPTVRAVLCSRGGYGTMQLLEELDKLPLADDPKWLIGFSDISALHALMRSKGIASIHASMIKGLAEASQEEYHAVSASESLFNLLRGDAMRYEWNNHQFNRAGVAEGTLVGGNLTVLSALIGTKFDMFAPDTILFIEDISEPIYKLQRMLWQLRLCGVLPRLKGLILGEFTGAKADANYQGVYNMIAEMVAPYDYPVAYDAPIGHGEVNYPLVCGGEYRLEVEP